jgi:CRP-like cAMP-binding protein
MYRQLANSGYRNHVAAMAPRVASLAESGQLDALVALERIGTQLSFSRNEEIYTEGDSTECWYKIISGTVRICKLLADGRRHITEFCFSGDGFGFDGARERVFSAEAVGDVIVMRFSRKATEQMIDQNPALARMLRETMLHDLTNVYNRLLLLGRMTATERVATFLIELFERCDRKKTIVVPMSRNDIADYVCLTIETVCRVLSTFKRDGIIAIPNAHSVELRDSEALEELAEA